MQELAGTNEVYVNPSDPAAQVKELEIDAMWVPVPAVHLQWAFTAGCMHVRTSLGAVIPLMSLLQRSLLAAAGSSHVGLTQQSLLAP